MRERKQRKRGGGFFTTLVLVWIILSFIVLRPGGRDTNQAVTNAPQSMSLSTPTPDTVPTSEPVALVPRPLAQVSDAAGEAGFTLCRRIRVVEMEGVILHALPVMDASSETTILGAGTELAVAGYIVSQPGVDNGWWLVTHPEFGEGYVTAADGCTQCVDAGR